MSMADTDTAIYAVMDKSKKKNRSPPERKPESPVYHVLERDPPVPAHTGELESEYPTASLGSMYSNLFQNIIDTSSTQPPQQPQIYVTKEKAEKLPEKQESQNKGTNCKSTACILLTIAVVAIILLICIAILFVEVAKLQQLQLLNNNSISEIRDNVHTTLPNSIGSLNVSFHEQLDRRLNTSIELLYEEVSATLDDHTERIDGLDQLLETVNSSAIDSAINSEMRLMELSRDFQFVVGQFMSLPLSSCAALPPSSPSGYYWVRASNGSAVHVYCNMTLSCGTISGGWMRVADINAAANGCPSDLQSHASRCRIDPTPAACSPVIVFSTVLEYFSVCGKVTAVLKGSPDGFADYGDIRMGTNTPLNGNYVDGVSITHGDLMHHIWTLAAYQSYIPVSPPSYVHGNYFCGIGLGVIWDGACSPQSSCCSDNPWFYRQLPQPTTDAIEMRVCRDQDRRDEDIEIQNIYSEGISR